MEYAVLVSEMREWMGSAMEASTLYLSIVTGFLIVAHTTAKDLSRFQLAFITFLFIGFALFFTYGTYGMFMRAYDLQIEWGSDTYSGVHKLFAIWIGGFQLLGIAGSLFFMYQAKNK